jgi:ABC-2 type transport system permease protein
VVASASAIAVAGSLIADRYILPGNGFSPEHGFPPLSLADGPTLRAAAGRLHTHVV